MDKEEEKWHGLAVSLSHFVDWCYDKHPEIYEEYYRNFKLKSKLKKLR